MQRTAPRLATALLTLALPLAAHAITVCDLDGQPIDMNNGSATAHKTGLVHCRDSATGTLQRDIELRDGVTMGVMRYYRKGVLQAEFTTNARGNREGIAREYAAVDGPKNPLVREDNYVNSTHVGLSRTWLPDGTPSRLTWYEDDGRESAVAEFTARGQLSALRCGTRPVFAPHADDASWCGFKGSPAKVTLYGGDGRERSHLVLLRGERLSSEELWENGRPSETSERTEAGGVDRRFAEDGVKRREVQWVRAGSSDRPRKVTVLDQEFHERGTLVRERRWQATERGADLVLEQTWYLNSQPRERQDYLLVDGKRTRRETDYHDNGRVAFEGSWRAEANDSTPIGVHKRFDDQGRLRGESRYDARGKLAHERSLDESGKVTRDDEVYEDGSRKAVSP